MNYSAIIFSLVWMLIGTGISHAAVIPNAVNVSATVRPACQILNVQDVSFGNYDASTTLTAQGRLLVACTKNTVYTIYIDAVRQMTNGSDVLAYQLYADPGLTKVWGSTEATGEKYTSAGVAPVFRFVYGELPAGQTVTPGAYANVNTVTVEW